MFGVSQLDCFKVVVCVGGGEYLVGSKPLFLALFNEAVPKIKRKPCCLNRCACLPTAVQTVGIDTVTSKVEHIVNVPCTIPVEREQIRNRTVIAVGLFHLGEGSVVSFLVFVVLKLYHRNSPLKTDLLRSVCLASIL